MPPALRACTPLVLLLATLTACGDTEPEDPASIEEAEAPCVELQPDVDCGTVTRADGCDAREGASEAVVNACNAPDMTDTVTDCVLSSIASGTSFGFSIETASTPTWLRRPEFAVASDGTGWTRTNGSDGTCSEHGVEARGSTSLEGCSDIDCVAERLVDAPVALECTNYTVCDE